jgi:RNA polymerase sigma factor (TIGR02999 family)
VEAEALFTELYGELRRLAARELARRGPYVGLGATTVVHEAYLGISGDRTPKFPDRGRFLAYATRAMRGLIIDHVRRRYAHKRGGGAHVTVLDTAIADRLPKASELQKISDALDELASVDTALAEVVDLKFFCGFSFAEIGAMHEQSERTVQRRWEKARVLLHRLLADKEPTTRRRSAPPPEGSR